MKRLLRNGLLLFAIFFAWSNTNAAHLSDDLLITARLNGSQEVPAVSTNARGVASFSLNATRDTICVDFLGIDLSGPITGIHVHEGVEGTNGPVVFNLTSFLDGNRVSAIITGSDLTEDKIAKYLSGAYYLNVHTAANPNGEIRGQLLLEADKQFKANLDPSQEVHAVTSNGKGLGGFILSLDRSKLEVKIAFTNMTSTVTGAHLHYGAMGENGPVAINLTGAIANNTIVETVDLSSMPEFVDSLMAGNVYINIHTTNFAAGEIRGQLKTNNRLQFDSWLNTSNETHTVMNSSAMGLAIIEISPSLDSIFTDILVDGLSGTITGAHLHEAPAGADGPVVVNLSTGISGEVVNTVSVGSPITSLLINTMLTSGIYVNVHTAMNPAGEVRGQVNRLAREGYTIALDGAQEVPMVNTTARGVGIVSIDRNRSNAHFMIVVEGLSGALTGAHFHNNVMGANGGVVFNLTSFFSQTSGNDAAYGFWTDADFTTSNEVQFRNDSIYVNIHTMMNASGEIRGQVERDAECFASITSTTLVDQLIESATVAPNPTSDVLRLNLTTTAAFEGRLMITSALGQVVRQQNISNRNLNDLVEINVANLSNGIYFLTIIDDETAQRRTIRFVKQ